MHVGFPIKLPANLTIALIERNQVRGHCRPPRNLLVHPCSQRVAVASRGCDAHRVEPPLCPADLHAANHPAEWPYELTVAPEQPDQPHRIPPPERMRHAWRKSPPPLADVSSRHVDVLG